MATKRLLGIDNNQVPRNKDLGGMAYQDPMAVTHGSLVNQITNTSAVCPTMLMDFANSRSVDTRLSFSRASTATYINSAGRVTNIGANQARIDFDPVTLKCKGLLIEEQRTNLCAYSAALENGGPGVYNNWTSATVNTNTAVAPDGTTTADTFVAQVPTATRSWTFSATAGTTYTFSMYIKRNPASNDAFLSQFGVSIAWSNNGSSLTSYTAVSVNAHTVPQGVWTRVSTSYTCPTGAISMQMGPSNQGQGGAGGGDQLYSIFVWGCQVEAGVYPTSLIPTNGSTATRLADSVIVRFDAPNNNITTVSGDYTLIFNFINSYNSGGNSPRTLAGINNSTFSAFVSISGSDDYSSFFGNGYGFNATGRSLGIEQKTASSVYSLNSTTGGYYQSFYANGRGGQTQSYQTPYGGFDQYGVNGVSFGGSAGTAGQGTAGITWVTKFAYYPFRLPYAELAEITQI
jgi:hypothetical protein